MLTQDRVRGFVMSKALSFKFNFSFRNRISLLLLLRRYHTYNCIIDRYSISIFFHHRHQIVLPKSRYFSANSGTKIAVLPKGRSSTANSGTKVAILLGMNRCRSFPLFPASSPDLASEQTLKDLIISQGPQRGGEDSVFG